MIYIDVFEFIQRGIYLWIHPGIQSDVIYGKDQPQQTAELIALIGVETQPQELLVHWPLNPSMIRCPLNKLGGCTLSWTLFTTSVSPTTRDGGDNKNCSNSPTGNREIKDLWLHTHQLLQSSNDSISLDDFSQLTINDTHDQETSSHRWDEFARQSSQHFRDTGELALSDWENLQMDLKNLQNAFDETKNSWSIYSNDISLFLHDQWGDSPQFRYQMMQDYQSDGSITSSHKIAGSYGRKPPREVTKTLQDHAQTFCNRFIYYIYWNGEENHYRKAYMNDYIEPLAKDVKKLHTSIMISSYNTDEWEERRRPENLFYRIQFCLKKSASYIKDAIEEISP